MQGQGTSVPLGAAHTLTLQAAQMATLTAVTITRFIDLQGEKIVRAFIKELPNPIVLWSGDAYDLAGDYTQADIEKQVALIINAM